MSSAILLDTHVLLWWLQGAAKLSPKSKMVLRDPSFRVLVSAASAWEIAIKYKAGKLEAASALVGRFQTAIGEEHFDELPVSIQHALRAGLLGGTHRDPFDRVLIAQAQVEGVPVVSNDKCFDDYGVSRIW